MKPELGTLIHATLRSEDLLPAFVSELKRLGYHGKRGGAFERASRFVRRDSWEDLTDDQMEEASELVNDCQDLLSDMAPPYCYFGNTEGDGSDFGFWPYSDWQQMAKDDGIPMEEPEADYSGLWFSISDHGNVTCYERDMDGKNYEMWGVV